MISPVITSLRAQFPVSYWTSDHLLCAHFPVKDLTAHTFKPTNPPIKRNISASAQFHTSAQPYSSIEASRLFLQASARVSASAQPLDSVAYFFFLSVLVIVNLYKEHRLRSLNVTHDFVSLRRNL